MFRSQLPQWYAELSRQLELLVYIRLWLDSENMMNYKRVQEGLAHSINASLCKFCSNIIRRFPVMVLSVVLWHACSFSVCIWLVLGAQMVAA